MKKVLDALDALYSFEHLGIERMENGTLLIGKAPHIAPKAWLHSIYPGLKEKQIELLKTQLGRDIPNDYLEFLKISNGIKLFTTTFCLDGFRSNYQRTIEDSRQPFDILIKNVMERSLHIRSSLFCIGGYDWDGSSLYIDERTNRVVLLDGDDEGHTIYEWDNFEVMFESEVSRLITLFDKNGVVLDEDSSTLPQRI